VFWIYGLDSGDCQVLIVAVDKKRSYLLIIGMREKWKVLNPIL
jgi:hypothetical protein